MSIGLLKLLSGLSVLFCATSLHGSTWTLPLSTLVEPTPVIGEVGTVPVDRGFAVLPHRKEGNHIFGSSQLIRLPIYDPDSPYTVKGVSGDWIWFTYNNSPNFVYAKTLANRIIPMDKCESLIDGAPRIVGNVHCDANALRIYEAQRLVLQISMPQGYRLRDLWPNSHFLLERLTDGVLVSARLNHQNVLELRDVYPVQSSELLERLSANLVPTRFSVGYRVADGYRIFSADTAVKVISNAQPLPEHQCFGDITPFSGPTVFVENVSGTRMWREYNLSNSTIFREFPLEPTDQFFFEQVSLGPRPMILRDKGATQQILKPSGAGLVPIYNTSPGERLQLLGRVLYAQNQDKSWELLKFFDQPARSRVTTLPDDFPAMAISRLGQQPLRLFQANRTATDQAEIIINEHSSTTGALLTSTRMPTDIDAIDQQQFSVLQVSRPERWPEDSELLLLRRFQPGASTGFLLNRAAGETTWRAFRSQNGMPAPVSATYVAGDTVFASNQATGKATLTQWSRNGIYLGEQSINVSPGSLTAQDNGFVLLKEPAAQGIRVAALAGAQTIWQREFPANCNVIDIQQMPLVNCVSLAQPRLSTLIRLRQTDGHTLWERLITPLQLNEGFEARKVFLRSEELHALSWTRNNGGSWKISAARLDAISGQLIAVAPNRLSIPTQPMFGAINAEDILSFPFYDPWVHLRMWADGATLRFGVRIDQFGKVSTHNLGLNASYSEHFADRISDDGVRWFAQTTFEDVRAIEARAYTDTRLTQALTLEHTIGPPGPNSMLWGVKIRIQNNNPVDALNARITLPRLQCGTQIDPTTGSRQISLNANSFMEFSCSTWVNPMRKEPEVITVLLRQPFNYDATPYYSYTSIVLQDSFLRNGFEFPFAR